MAVIIPDLFGAFQKGREYAIDRNWKDLENYETIEKMRTANDMAQLALLQERYYTPLKMSMFADNADNSAMQNQIQFTAFPGALSRARQYTNQAVSDEAVQANTLGDTAQTTIATTLADNALKRGQAQQTSSYARNTEWGKNGAIAAAMTNYKAGKALSNAEWEQVLFELRAEAEKGTLGQTIFMNGVNKKNRPLIEQLTTQVLNNDFASAQKTFEQIMKGEQGTGSSGQDIKYVNSAYKNYTNEDIGALIDKHTAIVKNPNTTDASKAVSNDIIRAAGKELADRGIDITGGNKPTSTPATGWGIENVSPFRLNPHANQNRTYQIDYRVRDEQGRLPIDYTAGVVGQGQQGVGVFANPTNYTGNVGNTNLLGDLSRYIDPASFTYNSQDLSGGGQPQQTTYQSPADADLASFENKILTNSKISAEQRNRISGAINLQRNSNSYNAWGGIVGENDQYRGSVLVNGRPVPYSTNTAVNLTALGNNLTPLQRELKQSLLLSGEFPVKSFNGKLEFDLDKLFPRIENNQVLTKPLIYGNGNYGSSSTNPLYR